MSKKTALQASDGGQIAMPQQLGSRSSVLAAGLSAALLRARLSLQCSAEGKSIDTYLLGEAIMHLKLAVLALQWHDKLRSLLWDNLLCQSVGLFVAPHQHCASKQWSPLTDASMTHQIEICLLASKLFRDQRLSMLLGEIIEYIDRSTYAEHWVFLLFVCAAALLLAQKLSREGAQESSGRVSWSGGMLSPTASGSLFSTVERRRSGSSDLESPLSGKSLLKHLHLFHLEQSTSSQSLVGRSLSSRLLWWSERIDNNFSKSFKLVRRSAYLSCYKAVYVYLLHLQAWWTSSFAILPFCSEEEEWQWSKYLYFLLVLDSCMYPVCTEICLHTPSYAQKLPACNYSGTIHTYASMKGHRYPVCQNAYEQYQTEDHSLAYCSFVQQ